MPNKNSFGCIATLDVDGKRHRIVRLPDLEARGIPVSRMPFAIRVLIENVLRREDGDAVTKEDVEALVRWRPKGREPRELPFMPARVLLQDFTGVPALVDLAAMRDAMVRMGGDPKRIVPLQPAELVIDHSVQVDAFGRPDALRINAEREFERNRERYLFLKWGQSAFDGFRVVPPATGIVHQVNLEYLARVVMTEERDGELWALPDTLVGTDSHTTMVNGLGVLGWGVGGIEAEAAMLGQPVSMLIPDVVGFRMTGRLAEGATATDLVLTVTQMLRERGVVGKLVEFTGDGIESLSLADRATIANMAPEYGATVGIFPIDAQTLEYLRFTGRSEERVRLVEAYARATGLFREPGAPEAEYTDLLELDLGRVEPSLAGPKRPQDRLSLAAVPASFEKALGQHQKTSRGGGCGGSCGSTAVAEQVEVRLETGTATIGHGSVVIAAITSCTNTSNPSVMLAAGLVARKARERGLRSKPWVKTSLAPGSKVVTDYLERSGLSKDLQALGFHVVGYGCTTCIGNSGPLPEPIARAIDENDLVVAAVLSGNRNFEGRIHPQVRANYLASPPLVVAYALAGRVDLDTTREPLGEDAEGRPVYLRDVWPTQEEVQRVVHESVRPEMFRERYANVYEGPEQWRALEAPTGRTYAWSDDSTYVKSPPFFEDMPVEPPKPEDLRGARVLVKLGDSVTTDHISPAGSIAPDSPAGKYLQSLGIAPADFNSYGARRGNHEVMMRGTFANVRLRNELTPDVEGSSTLHLPSGERTSIYDAAMRYRAEGVPTIVLAGAEYGTGSSRDWAAKGPALLGVRAVIATSFERIHRSNLVGMGVLPLEFPEGETASSLGLDGKETYAIEGVAKLLGARTNGPATVCVRAKRDDGKEIAFDARVRLDTPVEREYYRHGGILQYVLRRLSKAS